jgi:mRNA-degrading endonuclease toxin of MazEF toxin-antitoxin module
VIKGRKYRTGEIYLVRFHPAAGAELKRYRPAAIISSRANRADPRFILIAPLTTGGIVSRRYEMAIKRRGDLAKDSTLLVWYLRTIDMRRIGVKIAEFNRREVKILKTKLKNLLDL